ncbi:Os06g0310300 [Oryza sativa Japonica Group]|uniref:Os06g0310300 protein n=1 Tax=Oryza sativa subsp. japonica TaxID=39947 RepID=A0A0P0WVR6_ORYSJ|nr:Os06g0310300 [Oryza sativa Japonica Group]
MEVSTTTAFLIHEGKHHHRQFCSPNTEQKEVAGTGQNCSTCRLFRADYSELKEHANSRMMPSDSSLYLCDQV